jgi:hypothetical protein
LLADECVGRGGEASGNFNSLIEETRLADGLEEFDALGIAHLRMAYVELDSEAGSRRGLLESNVSGISQWLIVWIEGAKIDSEADADPVDRGARLPSF